MVLGSRLLGVDPMKQGMPWWKYVSNRFLTGLENAVFGLHLSEYHTGYRAFRREVLETVNLQMNSDNFIFDQEIMAQFVECGCASPKCPCPRATSRRPPRQLSCKARSTGCRILWLLARYLAAPRRPDPTAAVRESCSAAISGVGSRYEPHALDPAGCHRDFLSGRAS